MSNLIEAHSELSCRPTKLKIRTDREAEPGEVNSNSNKLSLQEAKAMIGEVSDLD